MKRALTFAALLSVVSCAAPQQPLTSTWEATELDPSPDLSAMDATQIIHLAADASGDSALATDATPAATVLSGETHVAVAFDAGVESAEIAWQLAHLADDPDQANPYDSEAVRQLAQRGATGVRALLPLLRRGDNRRTAFARTVIERVARRACGSGGRSRLVNLVRWFELGTVATARMLFVDAGTNLWLRAPTATWNAPSLYRVEQWAARGVPCDIPGVSSSVMDAGVDVLDE